MTTLVVVLGLVAVAGVPYLVWTRLEARKHKRAAIIHQDTLSLGEDLVPASIHPEVDLDECIGSGACVRACPEKDILAITDGRARLLNPLSCIGHSACMQACPVGAIKLVFGTATRGVELPRLTPSFETTQPGIFVIGELSGIGLIRNAVEQGRQAAVTIFRSSRRGRPGELDAIVVGAGPAGIAAALALIAHGLKVQIVDQDRYGGTVTHYPRSKVVMTGSFELPGYGSIRRKTMTKEQLLVLEAIHADGPSWRLVGPGWQDRAASVVLALGRRGAPRKLGVPGEELAKVAYRLIEPEPFADQHVLIVGGGNAAADCAIALARAKLCTSVSISYRRAELARLRSLVRKDIERCFAAGTIVPLLGTEVVSIAERHVTLQTAEGMRQLINDRVIVQIGGQPPSELLRTIGIELVEKRGEA
ncbi:MAG: 4Fe-4S dicluster domain-containing protein [Deltaproteobacteria bacterium]|nr:MAG: 4Fe-4S dicluster domain-containing protein [Deltaproteobacteria bacterium]